MLRVKDRTEVSIIRAKSSRSIRALSATLRAFCKKGVFNFNENTKQKEITTNKKPLKVLVLIGCIAKFGVAASGFWSFLESHFVQL